MAAEEDAAAASAPAERERTSTLEEMVTAYSGVMFRVAHAVLRNRAEAEDVVQDAFVRVLEQRTGWGAVRDARSWLVKIAWNLALDRRRRVRPAQMDEGFVEQLAGRSVAADCVLEEAQQMQAVLRAMDGLPRGERDCLLLAAVEELGTGEIGAVLGRSDSAVRALLFRARARLRQRLEKGGGR